MYMIWCDDMCMIEYDPQKQGRLMAQKAAAGRQIWHISNQGGSFRSSRVPSKNIWYPPTCSAWPLDLDRRCRIEQNKKWLETKPKGVLGRKQQLKKYLYQIEAIDGLYPSRHIKIHCLSKINKRGGSIRNEEGYIIGITYNTHYIVYCVSHK